MSRQDSKQDVTGTVSSAHFGPLNHAHSLFRGNTLMGNNSLKKCFVSLLKRIYSKRKEFAPHRSKFFHFRVDPFQKRLGGEGGGGGGGQKTGYLPCKIWWKVYQIQMYTVPLNYWIVYFNQAGVYGYTAYILANSSWNIINTCTSSRYM